MDWPPPGRGEGRGASSSRLEDHRSDGRNILHSYRQPHLSGAVVTDGDKCI